MLLTISPNIIGIAAGICTAVSLLPQLIKIWKEKKANDISIGMLLTLLSGLALWVWYGIVKSDLPIILTNAFSLVVNIMVITLYVKYKSNRNSVRQE